MTSGNFSKKISLQGIITLIFSGGKKRLKEMRHLNGGVYETDGSRQIYALMYAEGKHRRKMH